MRITQLILPVGRRTRISAQPTHVQVHSWRIIGSCDSWADADAADADAAEIGWSRWSCLASVESGAASGLLPRRGSVSSDPELPELNRPAPSLDDWRCKRKRCVWPGGPKGPAEDDGPVVVELKFVDEVDVVDVKSLLSESWALFRGGRLMT